MKKLALMAIVAVFSATSLAQAATPLQDQPCDPDTSSKCIKFTGKAGFPRKTVEFSHFFSTTGVQNAWLVPRGSQGTWYFHALHWMKMTENERSNHFHRLFTSEPGSAGPNQSLSFRGNQGLYKYAVVCEDDCKDPVFGDPYEFDLIVELP